MTMITVLCCMLALSSSVFGRYTFGPQSSAPLTSLSNVGAMRDLVNLQSPLTSSQGQVSSGYGQQSQIVPLTQKSYSSNIQQDITPQTITPVSQPISTGYGSQYNTQVTRLQPVVSQTYGQLNIPQQQIASPQQLLLDQQAQLQQKIQQTQVWTEADTLCRGQQPEAIIPLDNGRRFVVCLENGKGLEQQCPKGLLYHQQSRRCERKLGPLENPCSSQPCLNGGQCVQTEVSSFQCQCPAGFDGITCELDARVCQTQQPCGQSPDTKCQSFRVGAALQYICILQGGQAYGLNSQQVQPNPCRGVDGPQPLAVSDKGFIMCDGESMFAESCPGGTIWDDLNKACVWPDMHGVVSVPLHEQTPTYGQQSYGQQTTYTQQPTYTQTRTMPVQAPRVSFEQKLSAPTAYGVVRPSFEQIKTQPSAQPQSSSYGSQIQQLPQQLQQQLPQQFQQQQLPQQFQQQQLPQQFQLQQQLPQQFQQQQLPQQFQQQQQLPQQDTTVSFQPQQQTNQYQQVKPQIWQQPTQQDIRPVSQPSSGY